MIARNVTINGEKFLYASVRFENDRLVAKGFNKNEEIVNFSLTVEDLISFSVEASTVIADMAEQVVNNVPQKPTNAYYATKQKEITDFVAEQSMTETAPKKRGRPRKNPL